MITILRIALTVGLSIPLLFIVFIILKIILAVFGLTDVFLWITFIITPAMAFWFATLIIKNEKSGATPVSLQATNSGPNSGQ